MTPEFWHARWEENRIGFHRPEINLHLQSYWPKMMLAKGSTVFAPLCGKSVDMLWLLSQGYKVFGIEISPIAVADFFTENDLSATVTKQGAFQSWRCDDIEILCGDFFPLKTFFFIAH